jgi:hypothetical protein
MHAISSYFNKPMEELEWDDEDAFMKALESAGL